MLDNTSPVIQKAHAVAIANVQAQMAPFGTEAIPRFLTALAMAKDGQIGGVDMRPVMKAFEQGELVKANAVARHYRNSWKNRGAQRFADWRKLMGEEAAKSVMKAALDVGSQTNLANVTGGQSLGLISLDTRMARGTVRPKSFTLYNALSKTMAGQIVDYWAYASDVGGGLPGTVYSSYGSQSSGTALVSNSGSYALKYLDLKLTVDPRAITMALAQQNSFVDVAQQESANAALNTLSSIEWATYWGNPTLYANQPQGIAGLIPNNNIVDFWVYYNSASVQAAGISVEQALFNLIYQQAGFVTSWRQFGQITHAFMTPTVIGDLQSLVTTGLRNIVQMEDRAIVIDGELRGMSTSFGDIAFPLDFFISARDVPAQAQLREIDNTDFTTVLPAPTLSCSVVASGNVNAQGSDFSGAYTPAGGGQYYYCAAAADTFSNEGPLGFSAVVTGVLVNEAVGVTITPGSGTNSASVVAFRVFRSGVGFAGTAATWTNATNPNGGFANPASFKHIGSIASNGASAVTFYDLNQHIPGSETIFLLDLDEQDDALDYRVMLPISKIELFANNLYMPWAVASIGAPRVKIPKFHGYIKNYVPQSAQWSPTSPNAAAQPLI